MTAISAAKRDGIAAGIGWMVVTGFLFVGVTGVVRHLGSDMPAIEAAFIRYVFGLILVLPLMGALLRRRPAPRALGLYLVRGVAHAGAVMLWFFAMARIPIAEVTAIGYTTPIFVTVGAALFLGERFRTRRLFAVLVGLVGAMIILRPGFQAISVGQLAQLGAAPLFACSFILAKQLTQNESPTAIVGMLSLTCTLALLPGALLQWRQPTLTELGWLALTALLATAAHYAMTRALRAAPITVTQPITFLQLVWAMLLGIVAFGEPLDPATLIGGGIIVAAASYIARREMLDSKHQSETPAPAQP